jgi:uncharacterized membrane protein YraQ (UPF0718 family)
MNYVVLVFIVVCLLLYGIVFAVDSEKGIASIKSSYRMFTDPNIGLIPLIFAAIFIGGLVQTVIPSELITSWLGRESGIRGIALGALLGSVMPGGPYVSFPIAGAIYRAGASVGVIIAFVSSWSLLAFARLPLELPFLGKEVVAVRIAASLIFPIIIGLIGQMIYNMLD